MLPTKLFWVVVALSWQYGQSFLGRLGPCGARQLATLRFAPPATTAEPVVEATRTPAQYQVDDFEVWLGRNGISHPAVEIRERDVEGRGLFATRHIQKDEVLFVVPKNLIIRPVLPATIERVTPQAALALRILLERHRGAKSPFAPWLRALPDVNSMHMPLLWSEQDVRLLDWPDGEVFRWRNTVIEEGRELLKAVRANAAAFEGLTYTMEDWIWARAIALSRPYLLNREDDWSLAIIPLVDFTNHRDDSACAIRCQEDGSVAFVAEKAYTPQQQVWTSYGHVGAAHKFFTFGFLEELATQAGNPTGVPGKGSCFLSFPLADDNHARRLKLRVAEAVGLGNPAEFEVRVTTRWATDDGRAATVLLENENEIRRLMAYLRMAVAGPSLLDPHDGSELKDIWARFDTGPVTGEDRAAVTVALEACRDILRTAGDRLVACQNELSKLETSSVKGGSAARQNEPTAMAAKRTRSRRLKLASLWLQGELLAVQALAEYLLEATGAPEAPLLSYD